uniref:2-C-methyl-D-erythritol 4-phosphate cytidylyltransferase n=1 Tax=Thaumasiovibrio occultus TaxID=1891184 RepID=UPI000B3562C2|nr:2-C-methyl-D-erythritol 4-phosphate cytidylyltransferase [Thaumasiovibrio occultus]
MIDQNQSIVAVVPAAGVGKRMGADRPKQYLLLNQTTLIEHTLHVLLSHPQIARVVVSLGAEDPYFSTLAIANHPRITQVVGGAERVDSVLAGLKAVNEPWVMVHDAARPCVRHSDIDALIATAMSSDNGAILAAPVKDTMKRGTMDGTIDKTVCRENLWHALTPQMFRTPQLIEALTQAIAAGVNVTDEASAMEHCGMSPRIVSARSDNIKVTSPEDLALATFFLQQQERV